MCNTDHMITSQNLLHVHVVCSTTGYKYMYNCVYTHTCTYYYNVRYLYMYIQMYTFIYAHTCTHIHVHTITLCIHTDVRIHLCTYMYTVYTHIHVANEFTCIHNITVCTLYVYNQEHMKKKM